MTKRFRLAFSVLAIATSLISYSFVYKAGVSLDVVKVETGSISGVKNVSGDVTAYKGIPFAAPPVGSLRWKAPQPAAKWEGVRKCTQFGPSPMQKSPSPFFVWSE